MRSDDSGRRERTRPGFVLCAAVVREGLPLYFVFVYFIIKVS